MQFNLSKKFIGKAKELWSDKTWEKLLSGRWTQVESSKSTDTYAKADAAVCRESGVRKASRDHWFDGSSDQVAKRKQKGSDSWFRLQAFLNSREESELRALDPTYNQPIPREGDSA